MVHGNDHRYRSRVPCCSVCDDYGFQEGAGRLAVESDALLIALSLLLRSTSCDLEGCTGPSLHPDPPRELERQRHCSPLLTASRSRGSCSGWRPRQYPEHTRGGERCPRYRRARERRQETDRLSRRVLPSRVG